MYVWVYTRPIVTGPCARCEMLTVTFLVSFNLAHSDITIDISTQKSLLQDVELCTAYNVLLHLLSFIQRLFIYTSLSNVPCLFCLAYSVHTCVCV